MRKSLRPLLKRSPGVLVNPNRIYTSSSTTFFLVADGLEGFV